MQHRSLLCCLLLGLICTPVLAQQGWKEHTDTGELAVAYGKLDRAEQEFRAALEIAQRLPAGDRRLETSLENLARLLEYRERLDEAQPLYELLLVAKEIRLGADSPKLLDTLRAAGRVALGAGDVPVAEAHLQRFVKLAEAAKDLDPDHLRTVLSILSRMFVLQERPDEAVVMQRRSVALLEESILTPSERAAEVETLAHLELLHGSPEHAEQLLLDALALRAEDGEDVAVSTAPTMAEAAGLAFGAGELQVAERLARHALDSAGEDLDAHMSAQSVLVDVAWFQVHRGGVRLADLLTVARDSDQLDSAEQQLQALLELQESVLGGADPSVLKTLSRLVEVRVLRGHAATAAAPQRRIVEGRRSVGGPVLMTAVEDLAALLLAAGDDHQAAEVNNELITLLEDRYGPDDPRLLPVLQSQMELLKSQKRKGEAKALKKRIRKIEKAAGR